ncbi:MAG: MFS transporter [Proteobacteria bacterium]|nr:MFS transporter [Pseudomonadota bacterium]
MAKTQAAPFAAFHHRDFCFFQLMRFTGTLGQQMQSVAVGWQVYAITGRAIDLGYVGLVQFLPALSLALVTGHVADLVDRRLILIVQNVILLACAAALYWLTRSQMTASYGVYPIYAVLLVLGTARAFAAPAAQALLPSLVPSQDFSNAVAWSSTTWQVATILGPALGGFIFGWKDGAAVVYSAFGALVGLALVSNLLIRRQSFVPKRDDSGTRWQRLLAGVHYVRAHQILFGAISLDLFAVLLGGAVALLPVYARDILHVGPLGLGILRSAPSVGASVMAIFLAFRPLKRRAGKSMLAGVFVFGLATCVFGLSTNFYLSLSMLIIIGAADLISVYVRQTLVQLRTPESMRGRVSAVNQVFIGASNELGEFESGMTANWWGAIPATIIGGLGTLIVVALWAWKFPKLRDADELNS